MDGAKRIFLLCCSSCAGDIEVVAGQAGGRVACSACGTETEVPKFRDLGALRLKPPAAGRAVRRWGSAQGVIMGGAACALITWAVGGFVGAVPTTAIDVEATRAGIEAGDDFYLYQTLLEYAHAKVERMPLREEVMLQRRSRFARMFSRVLYGIGGLGAVAAAVAAASLLASPKRP